MGEHEWLLSVFDDLHRYAVENGLDATAEMIATKKDVARWEIALKTNLELVDRGNVIEVLFSTSGITNNAETVDHFD